jgi:hypothetical protein
MIGKIPTWWENPVLGNMKTGGKFSGMVGNFPQWEKIGLPSHGSFIMGGGGGVSAASSLRLVSVKKSYPCPILRVKGSVE